MADLQSRPSPAKLTLATLPNELQIGILGQLSGRATDFRSLMLTCRHFHSLLMGHDHIIAQDVVSRTSQTEKIILFNLAKTTTNLTPFLWLQRGHDTITTIDRILYHLERAGALQDENNIFEDDTTNQEPSPARRALRTILLTLQIITMQGDWEERCAYLNKSPPDLISSFGCHVGSLVNFLISNAYLYIQGLDAEMNGVGIQTPSFPRHRQAIYSLILHDRLVVTGPSLLLDLLEMRPKFAKITHFLTWLFDLYKDEEDWQLPTPANPNLTLVILPWLLDREHSKRWRGRQDRLGLKEAGDFDLEKWTRAIPDEKSWFDLMHKCGWIRHERSVRKLLHLP
jgi:hypothetical protein